MSNTIEKITQVVDAAKKETAKVIIGQDHVIEQSLIAIFTGHHVLIEGVPGVAKTLLVKTLAHVLGCDFSRIQFTPDLMPTDITGTNVFNLKENEFTLLKGPVFTTFLLADEINRAPAKTQSALLQAMQERVVTIDRTTYALNPDFTVFATQNPIEYEGTYPLPEAQKDRFLLKITMDHPSREEELRLARSMLGESAPESVLEKGAVNRIITPQILAALRKMLMQVTVKPPLVDYLVEIIRQTRTHQSVYAGAGPRATQSLLLAARAFAAFKGRDFVTPDDIKDLAVPTLEHRLVLRPEYEIEGLTVKEVIENVLQNTAVPR